MNKEITIDDIEYVIKNGQWVEKKTNLIPSKVVLSKLKRECPINDSNDVDYNSYTKFECIRLMTDLKNRGFNEKCIEVGLHLWRIYEEEGDIENARRSLPVITSVYRKLNKAETAIDFFIEAFRRYGEGIASSGLFNSIAGAYCDVSDYQTAVEFCDISYNRYGEQEQLSNVIARIKAQSDIFKSTIE